MKKVLTSMNTKMTKWLVASGDSWTAGTSIKDKNGKAVFWVGGEQDLSKYVNRKFPLWSEVLAKKLGMHCLNVGRGGAGNEFIYNRMIDTLVAKKNIGLAVSFWSHFDRWDFIKHSFRINPDDDNPFSSSTPKYLKIKRQEVLDVIYKHDMADGMWNFKKSLRWMLAFQNHCESFKIPYIQAETFYPTHDRLLVVEQKNYPRLLIENPIYDYIKEENFIGWPIFYELGGFTIGDKISLALRVDPPIDNHPNEEGHKLIAEIFYEHYKVLYEK